MRNSNATLVPLDTSVGPLPIAVRHKIHALVRQGFTIDGVITEDPDNYRIIYSGGTLKVEAPVKA